MHLLTFEGFDQSECTMTSRQWRKLWEAVGKTSPYNIALRTVVVELWTDFIILHQRLVNFETFCRCNFRSIVFFKRNRFLNNTQIRTFDGNAICLGPMSSLRLSPSLPRKFEDFSRFLQLRPRNANCFDTF